MIQSLRKPLRLRVLAVVLSSLALTFPSRALLDTNTNGLSDVWEIQHNNGTIFTPTNPDHAAVADPDQDGWSNAQEALAGTNPFDGSIPTGKTTLRITPALQASTYELTWPVITGKSYRVRASTDLQTWVNVGPIIDQQTVDTELTRSVQAIDPAATATPPRLFWRIIITDSDTDGDGLTTAEELALGLDPDNPTTLAPLADLDLATQCLLGLLNQGLSAVAAQALPDTDSDGDDLTNQEDAVPTDPDINWKRTPEARYVWIEQVNEIDPLLHPVAINKHAQILFNSPSIPYTTSASQYLWNSSSQQWVNLPAHGSLAVNIPWGPDFDATLTNTHAPVRVFIDINDEGAIYGTANSLEIRESGDILPGMVWKKVNATEYSDPTYFFPQFPIPSAELPTGSGRYVYDVIGGAIANDGTINAYASYQPFQTTLNKWMTYSSSTDPVSYAMSAVKDLGDSIGFATATLDKHRALFIEHPQDESTSQLSQKFWLKEESGISDLSFMSSGGFISLGEMSELPKDKDGRTNRLWITTGAASYIEKRNGSGNGTSRWHNPQSMKGEKVVRVSNQGVAITSGAPGTTTATPPKLWRNGKYHTLNDEKIISKPSNLTITDAIDIASNGIILAQATEGEVKKTGFLLAIEMVSRDKFFAGSIELPTSFDELEMEFLGPNDMNMGKYGDLLGGGSTKIYHAVEDILSEQDLNATIQPETQKVWFVKNSINPRKLDFYTCFAQVGVAKIRLHHHGKVIGTAEHNLTQADDFADVIAYVDEWVTGTSFSWNQGNPTPATPAATPPVVTITALHNFGSLNASLDTTVQQVHHLTRACLIPFFNVVNQVEGASSIAVGLLDGVKAGLIDDWKFIELIGQGVAFGGTWAWQQAKVEIEKWQNDPLKRASELKKTVDELCESVIFKALEGLEAVGDNLNALDNDLSTWEGFRRRAWNSWQSIQGAAQQVGNAAQKVWAVTKAQWPKIIDGLCAWADDFDSRMMQGVEKAHLDSVPWHKAPLLEEINMDVRYYCYTFGYTFGYLGEQVAVGALSAGATKLAQVLAKGGVTLAANLAKRSTAAVAARAHYVKKVLVDSNLGDAITRKLYEEGMVMCLVEPVGPTMKEAVSEVLEKAFSKQGFERSIYSWKHLQDDLYQRPKLNKLLKTVNGQAIFQKRLSQLATIMGDEFDATIAKNFAKVADEVICVPKGETVDEFFEGFFRAFTGNPGDMVHADIGSYYSKNALSPEGKATLKKFLSGPNAGKLWEIDVPAIVDNEPAIPHNYWIRGLLGELAVYKKFYKQAGYDHFPTAQAFDLKSAAEYVQIKTLKNPDGAYGAMKKAVDDLAKLPEPPTGSPGLKLHILKKPGSGSDQLEVALRNYINTSPNVRVKQVQLEIQPYELAP